MKKKISNISIKILIIFQFLIVASYCSTIIETLLAQTKPVSKTDSKNIAVEGM